MFSRFLSYEVAIAVTRSINLRSNAASKLISSRTLHFCCRTCLSNTYLCDKIPVCGLCGDDEVECEVAIEFFPWVLIGCSVQSELHTTWAEHRAVTWVAVQYCIHCSTSRLFFPRHGCPDFWRKGRGRNVYSICSYREKKITSLSVHLRFNLNDIHTSETLHHVTDSSTADSISNFWRLLKCRL